MRQEFIPAPVSGRDNINNVRPQNFVVGATKTVKPTLVAELRVAFSRFRQVNGLPELDFNVNNTTTHLPQFLVSGYPTMGGAGSFTGTTAGGVVQVRDNTYQVYNNVLWEHGRHAVKFGGEVVQVQYNRYEAPSTLANFQFTNGFTTRTASTDGTGDALASFFLALPAVSNRSVGPSRIDGRQWNYSAYIQDDPMNGVIGMTQLVLHTDLDNVQRDYISTVRDSAESLLVVINDILDFSKIEAGKMELAREPFALRKCVIGALSVFTWQAREKSLRLHYEIAPGTPEILAGDDDRLRQVLINLLGNAMKFTSEGEVSLSVSLESGPDLVLHFIVRDTGIGIPREAQSRIFQSFTQGDGSPRRQGGTGLGLAICSKLIAMMQGRIWVESDSGCGSAFHFTARFAAADSRSPLPVTPPPGAPGAAPRGRLKILLAEDNPVSQKVAQRAIERMGHSVLVAGNGLRALEATTEQTFDLILMDLQMPEMDGFESAARIRRAELPLGRYTPIVAMTANAMRGDRENCLQHGFDEYIAKPIDLRLLPA